MRHCTFTFVREVARPSKSSVSVGWYFSQRLHLSAFKTAKREGVARTGAADTLLDFDSCI
jgi:hypothetical protein